MFHAPDQACFSLVHDGSALSRCHKDVGLRGHAAQCPCNGQPSIHVPLLHHLQKKMLPSQISMVDNDVAGAVRERKDGWKGQVGWGGGVKGIRD